ncbi:MAG: FxsA family protein [Phycisphaerae bacterium]|jgi:UPF0716 protein FxsA
MFLRLLLLLTIIPLVELWILFELAQRFSWEATIGLVILTGVLGAWLARREGLKTVARIQSDMARGIPPAAVVVEGALILLAGVVLVTPGVLTDICGFVLLVPPLRRRVGRYLVEVFKKRIVVIHPGQAEDDEFIDVEGVGRNVDREQDILDG